MSGWCDWIDHGDGVLIMTAPDFSFTATATAALEVFQRMAQKPPPPDAPDWFVESAIFELMTKAEGYSYETARSLIDNQYYCQLIHEMWLAFQEAQKESQAEK